MGRVDLHTTPKAVASAIEPMDAAKKLRLQKAAKDFEAVLVGYMLKSMRSSVQKADEFGESFGSETIEGMFDSEVARSMSRGGSFGIAEMLYKKLAGEPMPKHPAHAAASVVRPASGTTAAAVGGQRSEPAMASPPPAAAFAVTLCPDSLNTQRALTPGSIGGQTSGPQGCAPRFINTT